MYIRINNPESQIYGHIYLQIFVCWDDILKKREIPQIVHAHIFLINEFLVWTLRYFLGCFLSFCFCTFFFFLFNQLREMRTERLSSRCQCWYLMWSRKPSKPDLTLKIRECCWSSVVMKCRKVFWRILFFRGWKVCGCRLGNRYGFDSILPPFEV